MEREKELPDDVREACELTVKNDAPMAPYAEVIRL